MVEVCYKLTGWSIPEAEFAANEALTLDFAEDADLVQHLQRGRVGSCGSWIIEQLALPLENENRNISRCKLQCADQTDRPSAGNDDLIDRFVLLLCHLP